MTEPIPTDYQAAHRLIRKIRGKASGYECVRCGNQAREWALSQKCIDKGMKWSPDPYDYYPLCRSDHVFHDIPEERRKEIAREAGQKGGAARSAHMKDDPVWAAELAERMLAVQRAGGQATGERLRTDPELAASYSERMANANRDPANRDAKVRGGKKGGAIAGVIVGRIRRQCNDCGLVTTPGPMGRHLSLSGHTGFTEVSPKINEESQ